MNATGDTPAKMAEQLGRERIARQTWRSLPEHGRPPVEPTGAERF
ncbi:MAG TPA: hypothetical protein VNU48_10425 [Burkholderiaceae bacterium]|nr:hypothetical protein [Burkholderiaceae bacterium]